MVNVLSILMGLMDVVSGVIILTFLHEHQIALIFAILMIGKGSMSFWSFS